MLHTKKIGCWFWRRFLKDFYHIWVWRPSWSCDPDAANKLSIPLPQGGSTLNLALIEQAVLEKMFEIVYEGRTPPDGRRTMSIL